MKKRNIFLAFIFTLICLFGLCSCENIPLIDKLPFNIGQNGNNDLSDEEIEKLLNDSYEEIKKAYVDKTITKDLALPLELENGATVAWTSSNHDAVLDNGNIADLKNGGLDSAGNLPTSIITGVISYKGSDQTKEYSFTVTVNKLSNDATSILSARAVLLSQYEGVSIDGYRISGLTEDGNVESYTYEFPTREDVTIEYLNSDRLTFNGNVATVKRPTESECNGKDYVVETLKAKITLNDVSIIAEIPFQITKQTKLLTVTGLREIMNSESYVQKQDEYTFRGTVSLVWEMNTEKSMQGFFVQDENSALLIYSASISDKMEAVEVGDEVLITATTCFYNGLAETSSVSAIQILVDKENNTERYNNLERIKVTSSNFNDEDLLGKDSCLASIDELIYDHMTDTSDNIITEVKSSSVLAYFYFRGIKGKCVCISLDKYSSDYTEIGNELNALKQGDIVTVKECAISWFTDGCDIKIANKGQIEIVAGAELTETEIYKLDKTKLDTIAPDTIYACGTFELATSLPFGTEIEWTLKEGSNEAVSIVDGNLVISEFDEPFEFTLIAEMVKDGGGTKKEYTSTAVNPVSISDVISAIDSTEGLKSGTAVKGYVIDELVAENVIVLCDGNDFITVSLPEEIEIEKFNEITILLSSGKFESGAYKVNCSSVVTIESKLSTINAELVELSELTSDFRKVELKNVTIQDGKANVNETIQVEFVYNTAEKEHLADGEYKYLKGYTLKKDENTILFYALGTVGTNGVITISAESLLGYEGTNVPYSGAGYAELENIMISYNEIGAYGAGTQWRAASKSSNGISSSMANTDPINARIEKIVLEVTSTKTVYAAEHCLDISFGTTVECEGETQAIGTIAGEYEIIVTPNSDTYTYFSINHVDAYTYAQYFSTITIYLVDGVND